MCPLRRYSENSNPDTRNPLSTKNKSTPYPPGLANQLSISMCLNRTPMMAIPLRKSSPWYRILNLKEGKNRDKKIKVCAWAQTFNLVGQLISRVLYPFEKLKGFYHLSAVAALLLQSSDLPVAATCTGNWACSPLGVSWWIITATYLIFQLPRFSIFPDYSGKA